MYKIVEANGKFIILKSKIERRCIFKKVLIWHMIDEDYNYINYPCTVKIHQGFNNYEDAEKLIIIFMTISKIKEFLKQRGINPHLKIERNGRVDDLYCIFHEFNDCIKHETKRKIINELENVDISD